MLSVSRCLVLAQVSRAGLLVALAYYWEHPLRDGAPCLLSCFGLPSSVCCHSGMQLHNLILDLQLWQATS